jgi:hypothetical protein
MRDVSFDKEALNITICNLYPDLKLISPVYFNNRTACHVSPNQQIDTGDTMEASFGIDSERDYLEGALLYKLQRKHVDKTDNQPNNSTVSTKDTTTNTYLLVVWNDGEKWINYRFYVYLIECANDFIWDEDKLWALCKEYEDKFHKNYKDNIITWLMNDGILMKTRFDITYGSDYKLDVIISEGVWGCNMLNPIKIDLERLVLSLSLLMVLMYAVSLHIRPSFKLNIHNQCLNIDLISPTYFTDYGLECHRSPNYKVCAGDIMSTGFISEEGGWFHTALIYRLQRRLSRESSDISKDTSSVVHLLVVWEVTGSDKLYTDVLVIEHDEGFIWNKKSLRDLHLENIYSVRRRPDSTTEIWSLNDNIALMTTFEIMNKDRTVNITISEAEKHHSTKMPIHIDLKR